ncbi:MAG TPA: hypothetical protein PLX03_10590, partial [Candidatus Hydrogenedentes bacterium]|nr:hypothetical protein [Candidatus Hydrogenedentota bacterium]
QGEAFVLPHGLFLLCWVDFFPRRATRPCGDLTLPHMNLSGNPYANSFYVNMCIVFPVIRRIRFLNCGFNEKTHC